MKAETKETIRWMKERLNSLPITDDAEKESTGTINVPKYEINRS